MHGGGERDKREVRSSLSKRALPIGMFRWELGSTDYWDVADLDSPPWPEFNGGWSFMPGFGGWWRRIWIAVNWTVFFLSSFLLLSVFFEIFIYFANIFYLFFFFSKRNRVRVLQLEKIFHFYKVMMKKFNLINQRSFKSMKQNRLYRSVFKSCKEKIGRRKDFNDVSNFPFLSFFFSQLKTKTDVESRGKKSDFSASAVNNLAVNNRINRIEKIFHRNFSVVWKTFGRKEKRACSGRWKVGTWMEAGRKLPNLPTDNSRPP